MHTIRLSVLTPELKASLFKSTALSTIFRLETEFAVSLAAVIWLSFILAVVIALSAIFEVVIFASVIFIVVTAESASFAVVMLPSAMLVLIEAHSKSPVLAFVCRY